MSPRQFSDTRHPVLQLHKVYQSRFVFQTSPKSRGCGRSTQTVKLLQCDVTACCDMELQIDLLPLLLKELLTVALKHLSLQHLPEALRRIGCLSLQCG